MASTVVVLEFDVLVERVDGRRMSEKADFSTQARYSLSVSLSEKDWKSDSLVLAYSIELASQPPAAKILVAGSATIRGPKNEIQAVLTPASEKVPPPIVVTIYERVYGMIYLLAGSLRVTHPLPNLLEKGP